MSFLSSFFKSLSDFLFPKNEKVQKLESLSLDKLLDILPRAQVGENLNAIALFDYSHPLVKEIVWEIKYGGNRALSKKIGTILYDVIEAELAESNVFEKEERVILMPMPVSDKRRFERGWNQAELLTEAIKNLDEAEHYKYLPRQLVKIRHTERQTTTAHKKERLENLQGSMLVQHPQSVEGRFVVLVDDVATTGATFKEAKRALYEAGARKILCFAIAH